MLPRFISTIFFLLWANCANAVVVVTSVGTGFGTGSTVAVSVGSNIPLGASVYVLVQEDNQALSGNGTVTDNAGTPNTYSLLTNHVDAVGTFTQIFQAFNINAINSGKTITYHQHNNGDFSAATVIYVTGLSVTNPYDSAVTASSDFIFAQPTSVTSGTPSLAGELFLVAVGYGATSTSGPSYSADTGNGWVNPPPPTGVSGNDTTNSRQVGIFGEYQINAGTSTKTAAPTASFTSINYGATIIIGLKGAAAASAGNVSLPLMGVGQ